MTKKEPERKFCPKCGSELHLVREENDKDFHTNPYWAYGYPVNRAGMKFSSVNGKRMYRTEWHCPTLERRGWFKPCVSHYVLLGDTNLTD